MEWIQIERGKCSKRNEIWEKTGQVYILKGDLLQLITTYKFNTTNSRIARTIILFSDVQM